MQSHGSKAVSWNFCESTYLGDDNFEPAFDCWLTLTPLPLPYIFRVFIRTSLLVHADHLLPFCCSVCFRIFHSKTKRRSSFKISLGLTSRSVSHRPLPRRCLNRSEFVLLIIRVAILLFASLPSPRFLGTTSHALRYWTIFRWGRFSKVSKHFFPLIG